MILNGSGLDELAVLEYAAQVGAEAGLFEGGVSQDVGGAGVGGL